VGPPAPAAGPAGSDPTSLCCTCHTQSETLIRIRIETNAYPQHFMKLK
jgi:hypothetical protein